MQQRCIGIDYVRNGQTYRLYLHLDRNIQFLVFQGLDCSNIAFTHKVEEVYYSLNNTLVLLEYKEKVNFSEAFKGQKIETEEDYINLMSGFAVKPKYILHFQNNMNWFSHYEVKIDNEDWIKIHGEDCPWDLVEGMNTLNVRSVNKAGVKGPATNIKIQCGVDSIE